MSKKTNYKVITANVQELGQFLGSSPILDAPWDVEFQRRFCAACKAEDCGACENEKYRNNPEWWLTLEASEAI